MIFPNFQIDQLLENLNGFGEKKSAVRKSNDFFSGVMKNILTHVNADKGLDQGSQLKAGIREKSPNLLESIKKYLLSKGISLDQVYADDAALGKLKRFLESAGFDGRAVGRLMSELNADTFKHGVRLSDLFAKLSELGEKGDSDTVLDISAYPYIESILSKLLPEPKYQHAALKDVKNDGQGVNLSQLVENLRQIIRLHPEKGRFIPDETGQRQLHRLFNRFGIESDKLSGNLTLDRFVSGLEKLTAQVNMGKSRLRVETKELKGFFDHLKPVDESHAGLKMVQTGDPLKGLKSVQNLKTEEIPQQVFNPAIGIKKPGAPVHAEGQRIDHRVFRLEGEGAKAADTITDLKNTAALAESHSGANKFAERMGMPEPKAPVRTLPAYVLNQVSRQIIQSHKNGMNEIGLQLKPPHLGRLQMHINHSGDTIRISIVTQQQAAREILMSHAVELRSTLTEQGMRVEKIDIQFDQNFDQSMANARHESQRSNERRQRGSRSKQNLQKTAAVSESGPESIRVRQGILDLVA